MIKRTSTLKNVSYRKRKYIKLFIHMNNENKDLRRNKKFA